MAHGKSLLLRNIRKPAPVPVYKHESVAMADRSNGGLAAVVQAKCEPYMNPGRDLKPGRRLRMELRSIPLCDSDGIVRKGGFAYDGAERVCPGGAIINGFTMSCWSTAHTQVLTHDQVREVV